MNFDKYRIKIPCPKVPNFPSSLGRTLEEKFLLLYPNLAGLEEEIAASYKEESIPYKQWQHFKILYEEYVSLKGKYQTQISLSEALFKKDALAEVGLCDHPKRDKIFALALNEKPFWTLNWYEVMARLEQIADILEGT